MKPGVFIERDGILNRVRIERRHQVSPLTLEDRRGLTPGARCTAETLASCYNGEGFSGVSYYFAKYLQAGLGVPVGIINTSWGGTRIEPWTPPAGFEPIPSLAGIAAHIRANQPGSAEYQQALKDALAKVETWLPAARTALANGAFAPALPTIASASALSNESAPNTLYNAVSYTHLTLPTIYPV